MHSVEEGAHAYMSLYFTQFACQRETDILNSCNLLSESILPTDKEEAGLHLFMLVAFLSSNSNAQKWLE